MVVCDVPALAQIINNVINSLHVNLTLDITVTVAVTLMGIRSWLLKPYLERMEALEAELKALKEEDLKVRDELREVLRALNEKADKADLKDVRMRLNSLEKALDNIITRMEAQEIILKREEIISDKDAQKELVLRLIREGYTQPTKILGMAPFGSKRLYEILKELEAERLIKKIKKKRKVYYVAEEGAY